MRLAATVFSILAAAVAVFGPLHQAGGQLRPDRATVPRPDFRGKITGDAPGHVLLRINYVDGTPDTMRYTVRGFDYYCDDHPGVPKETTFSVRKADFVNRHTFDYDRTRFGTSDRTRFHGRLLPAGGARGFFSFFNEDFSDFGVDCGTNGRLRWEAHAVGG